MRILVTGGTGFVGGYVVEEFCRQGHKVRLLIRDHRSPKCDKLLERFKMEVAVGSLLNEVDMKRACAAVDGVIHLVGIIAEFGSQTYENVHVESTRNLIEAARATGVKRFVHMSALGTRPNARARYHQTKWEAEQIVRQSGIPHTIFRPSVIYGKGDGFVSFFSRMARWSPFLPVIGSGQSKLQPIPAEDVARSFVGALQNDAALGETLDLCGTEVVTFVEFLDLILQAQRRRRLKLRLPIPVANFQADLCELLYARWLRIAPPLTRDQILMIQEDNTGDREPAAQLFNLSSLTLRDGLKQMFTPVPG